MLGIYKKNKTRINLKENNAIFSNSNLVLVSKNEKSVEVNENILKNKLLHYNIKNNILELSTDKFSINDVFYFENKDIVVFSDCLKEMFSLDIIPKKINQESLEYFLAYQFVPKPLTMFENIKRVPAAHKMIISENVLKLEKYWDLDFNPDESISKDEHCKKIRNLLKNSIKSNIEKSNKKVGLLLSGGLDSTIIGYLLKEENVDLYTFTGTYPFDASYGGNKYGSMIAKELGSKHRNIEIKEDSIKILPELYKNMNDPLADGSLLQAYIIMKEAKKTTTNLFAGEFSDILFAGMDTYLKYKLYNMFYKEASASKQKEMKTNNGSFVVTEFINQIDNIDRFKHYTFGEIFFDNNEINKFLKKQTNIKENIDLSKPILSIYNSCNFKTELEKQLYTDLKIASQRRVFHLTEPARINCVDLKLPYTNTELINYSGLIPDNLKINNFTQKFILKESFKEIIPKVITQRSKEGFTAPFNLWFDNNSDWIINQFKNCKLWDDKICDHIKNAISIKNKNHKENMKIWILLNLTIWYNNFF